MKKELPVAPCKMLSLQLLYLYLRYDKLYALQHVQQKRPSEVSEQVVIETTTDHVSVAGTSSLLVGAISFLARLCVKSGLIIRMSVSITCHFSTTTLTRRHPLPAATEAK